MKQRENIKKMIVKGTNKETGKVRYWLNAMSFVHEMGCTKQLVYQVLSDREHFKAFKSAKGWILEFVEFNQADFKFLQKQHRDSLLANKISKDCKSILKKVTKMTGGAR